MAASLTDMYPKRKMEDITNRHKKAKLDSKLDSNSAYVELQERSPSPSSPSSSSSPRRSHHQKSVSFELSRNEHFECPLLTPRDEDYDLDSDHNEEQREEPGMHQLDSNADYIALGSSASLLTITRDHIKNEISELSLLQQKAKRATKSDLVDFYVRLIYDKQHLPVQHKIVKAPEINWANYKEGLANISLSNDCMNDEKNSVFSTINMFNSSSSRGN